MDGLVFNATSAEFQPLYNSMVWDNKSENLMKAKPKIHDRYGWLKSSDQKG